MKIFKNRVSADLIPKYVSGTLIGEGCEYFDNVAELHEANQTSICFYEHKKYYEAFKESKAGLIIIPENIDDIPRENQLFLKVNNPYICFLTIVSWWQKTENDDHIHCISEKASIHSTAKIASNVNIEPFVVIGENVEIGENCHIGANSVILNDTKIGNNTIIYPNVTIYHDTQIGNDCIIHSGAVIGADGFGYISQDGMQIKVLQVGNVIIENDVEIGANSCVDRATIGTTIIKNNTKIDNLVQIAHNCTIDEHSILCAQVGLAGNSHIGKGVYLAGQVGVAGHLKIHDNTLVGAQSGIASTLKTGKYFGTPAISAFQQKKIVASLNDLPQITAYIKKLMKLNKDEGIN
jgi:UDP-3-O-[3-hydroxymyristoyl] glucosamine N-acyltransferase